MLPEIIDQWSKFARTTLETFKELGDLNTRFIERASQQQLELANVSIDATIKSAHLASEARSYKDFVTGQVALANEYGDRVLKVARKGNDAATELREEYSAWLEGKVREAVAPLVRTAPAASKKAA